MQRRCCSGWFIGCALHGQRVRRGGFLWRYAKVPRWRLLPQPVLQHRSESRIKQRPKVGQGSGRRAPALDDRNIPVAASPLNVELADRFGESRLGSRSYCSTSREAVAQLAARTSRQS